MASRWHRGSFLRGRRLAGLGIEECHTAFADMQFSYRLWLVGSEEGVARIQAVIHHVGLSFGF